LTPERRLRDRVAGFETAPGGPAERVVQLGADHHPRGHTDPKPVVDFFTKAWSSQK
jgi:hypothetical protein